MKKLVIESVQIIAGTFLMACSTALFLLPNHLSSGGFVGIATITYYWFNWSVGTVIMILNIPLFIVSFIKLGKSFFIKAIIGTGLISIFIDLLSKYDSVTQDKLLACIYGGILSGLGIALIFKANASTGGTDLSAKIIKEFKPKFKVGELLITIDAAIILLNMIAFRKIEIGLYSGVAIFVTSKILDIYLEGIHFAKTMYIISEKTKEIASAVNIQIARGVTGIYAKGIYNDEDKMILLCVIGKRQIPNVKELVYNIDEKAFLIIGDAREVVGKGFKE